MKNNPKLRNHGFYIILLLVLLISCKNHNPENTSRISQQDTTSLARDKIRKFWEVYRSAQEFRSQHKFIDARDDFRLALEINPDHEDALFNYGNMCYELEEFPEAEKAWNHLIVVNPMNARAHYQLGNLYLRYENPEFFNLDKSAEEFDKARNLNRQVTGPLLHLGQISLIRNKLKDAEQYFLSVIGTDPKGIEAYFQLGYIDWREGKVTEATGYFGKAVSISRSLIKKDTIQVEGDTKLGKPLASSVNRSVFNDFIKDLSTVADKDAGPAMNRLYTNQEKFIVKLRKTVGI